LAAEPATSRIFSMYNSEPDELFFEDCPMALFNISE
jgi:hypothetical protein